MCGGEGQSSNKSKAPCRRKKRQKRLRKNSYEEKYKVICPRALINVLMFNECIQKAEVLNMWVVTPKGAP